MTHGCLLITNGDPKYDALLHTYHTGMHIALWVKRIPTLMYNKRLYLRDRRQAAELLKFDGSYTDRLKSPQAVAAAVITVSPECLEPLPGHNDVSELPSWGGQDCPVVLKLISPNTWIIEDHEKPAEVIDPHQMFVDLYPETGPAVGNWNPPRKYPDCQFLSGTQIADAPDETTDVML